MSGPKQELSITGHPNFVEDAYLLQESDVSNILMNPDTIFSANLQQKKSDDQKSQPNFKSELTNQNSQPNLTPVQPRSILRSGERTKTTVAKLNAINQIKDEVVENLHNQNRSEKSPTFKDTIKDSSNLLGSSPAFSNASAQKKNRQTRLFKGQIIQNDIFEEKVTTPVVVQMTKYTKFKEKVELLTKNPYLEIFFNIMIFYTLFADDFRTIFLPKSADDYLDSVTVVCIFVFTCEITVSLIIRKGYFNSFFFYLDIVSTLTLFFDLTYVYEQLFYKSAFANRFQIARASRATRIGARAGRLVKFFNFDKFFVFLKGLGIKERLFRKSSKSERKSEVSVESQNNSPPPIVSKPPATIMSKSKPVVKPMKGSNASQQEMTGGLSGLVRRLSKYALQSFSSQTADEIEDKEMTKESRVGKKLSELTMKRVILITLFLLLFVPVFSAAYQFPNGIYVGYCIQNLASMVQNNVSTSVINATLNNFISDSRGLFKPLIAVTVPSINISLTWVDIGSLRNTDFDSYQVNDITATIDLRGYNNLDSMMNILRTLFMCAIFLIGALIFSKDANDLALRPIERMIEKVNRIANNPLKALEEGIRGTNQNMETVLIENAIIKIGTLLALGFGDAGSEVIAKNISKGNSGSVNPLLPGKRHYAIFGFCDIRNFTDVTEVLQEEVMLFVNTIASIVHRTIDKYIGNANKNIGDAFLLVWKIPDEEIQLAADGVTLVRTKMIKSLCDLSVISYIKTIARLNSYPEIIKYNNNRKINERINNYKVKMGFGLHLGWAIEGAIGSIYKIDASYLSPNVNIASRLEAATKQYGLPMLISDSVWDMCSNEMRRRMREIDKVTVKGSKNPISLFTVDLNMENLKLKEEKVKTTKKRDTKAHKQRKMQLMNVLENDLGKCIVFIESDEILVNLLTANYNYSEFSQNFNAALEDYLGGLWKEAKTKFEAGLKMKPEDGPTKTLLNYMEGLGFEAPVDWKGYRELTEK